MMTDQIPPDDFDDIVDEVETYYNAVHLFVGLNKDTLSPYAVAHILISYGVHLMKSHMVNPEDYRLLIEECMNAIELGRELDFYKRD